MFKNEYIYLGDKLTRPDLRRMSCLEVRHIDTKCVRDRNGNMLVEFPGIGKVVVLARLLRKIRK